MPSVFPRVASLLAISLQSAFDREVDPGGELQLCRWPWVVQIVDDAVNIN